MDLNPGVIVLFGLNIIASGTMHGLLIVVLQNVYFIDLAAAGAGGTADKSLHGRLPSMFNPLTLNRSHLDRPKYRSGLLFMVVYLAYVTRDLKPPYHPV